MGKILDAKQFMNDNIFNYEQRLESQYTIFLDKNPTFVTYYHICNATSITDTGFLNVERVIGDNSPVQFQRIEDFPIYGIESIKLDLSDEDQGLTSSFEGEGIILPNTIQPYPNDCFTISYLDRNYLFMISSVNYDTIKSNNFYNISFFIKTLNPGEAAQINNQIQDRFTCIFENIGTDDKCLMKVDEYEKIVELEKVYDSLVEQYMTLYYNSKYNSLLFAESDGTYLYDKYLTRFVMDNKLFNRCDRYDTVYLSNEDPSKMFDIQYKFSVYNTIEEGNVKNLKPVRFMRVPIANPQSIFKFYNMTSVKSVQMVDTGNEMYIPDCIIGSIQVNNIDERMDILDKLLIKYFNGGIESIYNLETEQIAAYRMKYNIKEFIMIPIMLYIILKYTGKFIKNENEIDEYTLI